MAEVRKIDELILATTNAGKLLELRQMLAGYDVSVKGLDDFDEIEEPAETGKTFADNARLKAVYYGRRLGGWVLADDSGLQVDALDGSPGVYSARFAGCDSGDSKKRDAANNAKVLDLLADVHDDDRSARFCCALCLAYGGSPELEVQGRVEGIIARAPAGDNGFGYDPLFYVPGVGKTVAQLPPREKNSLSHRGNALRLLMEKIECWLKRKFRIN